MSIDFSNIQKDEIKEFYYVISNNVKKYRLEKGLSQLELALQIDIKSVAFFSNCECNRYDKHFNIEHIYKLSKALEIELCLFFIR